MSAETTTPPAVRYHIEHLTACHYAQGVSTSRHLARLRPLRLPFQRPRHFRLEVEPTPAFANSDVDYFGNTVDRFSIVEPHERLQVVAHSEVEVAAAPAPDLLAAPAWETVRDGLAGDRSPGGLAAYECRFPSAMVPAAPGFADYARPSFEPGRPLLDAAMDLTLRIHAEFQFDPTATTVATPIRTVLEDRRGVCQDFAHLQIACLRALGLPARYVSGYIRTDPPPGKKRLVGADATHAWVAVYCPGHGWVEFDPTNRRLAGDSHVRVAYGRDFSDVSPLRGTVVGGGTQRLDVAVTMRPDSEPAGR